MVFCPKPEKTGIAGFQPATFRGCWLILPFLGHSLFLHGAPENTVPAAVTVTEDINFTFTQGNESEISVADPATESLDVSIILADLGELKLSSEADPFLLSFEDGDTTGSHTEFNFSGKIADINEALNGMIYIPMQDEA